MKIDDSYERYINILNNYPKNVWVISFERLVSDDEYRKTLRKKLGLFVKIGDSFKPEMSKNNIGIWEGNIGIRGSGVLAAVRAKRDRLLQEYGII